MGEGRIAIDVVDDVTLLEDIGFSGIAVLRLGVGMELGEQS